MRPDFIAPLSGAGLSPVAERAAALNARYRHHGATAVLRHAMEDAEVGRLALVSSFGAESVVLLHMVAVTDRHLPVLFIDTEMLFAETLAYQLELTERLRLSNVQVVRARREDVFERDNEGLLHQVDPDACCALRKTEPLQRALLGFDAWITGRKRYQGGARAALDFFEAEGDLRIKVNPLAHWTAQDVQDYIAENRLPRHPLVAKGFPSIGCAPCTTRVGDGEDPRAGRWRDLDKMECGIHVLDGRIVRTGPVAA
jgi:phosphoadenosine phosphosulfate reductase